MKTRSWLSALLALAGLITQACEVSRPVKIPDEVTLQLKWMHQAQFAGFYMAQEKGHYAQENLKVRFLEGGQDIDIAQRVISGQADFGVLTPEFIFLQRSQGAPLTAIASIYRRSAVVFVSKADSGIVRPSDFIGKSVAVGDLKGSQSQKDFELQFQSMMKKLRLDVAQVRVVPYDPDYIGFGNGTVDATPCYATGGLIKMRHKGLKLNLIWPSDYGIHFYSDTLTTTEKVITERPDLVKRFLRATVKGWRDAVENTYQAVSVTLKYAQAQDRQLQTAMMEAMLPLVHPGEDRIGWMRPQVWQEMYKMLIEQNQLPNPVEMDLAYTLRFLEEIYGGKNK